MNRVESASSPLVHGLRRALSSIVGVVFVWGLFSVLVPDSFLTIENQRLMLLQTAVVGTAAIGATFIIVAGGIDLSVGSTIALGTVCAALALEAGAGPLGAALVALGAAAGCGLVIGALVIGRMGEVLGVLVMLAVVALARTCLLYTSPSPRDS